MSLAVIAHTVEMTEKIKCPRLGGCGRLQDTAPDARGIGAAHWFAVLIRFDQFETDRTHVCAQIEWFDVEQVQLFLLGRRVRESILIVG